MIKYGISAVCHRVAPLFMSVTSAPGTVVFLSWCHLKHHKVNMDFLDIFLLMADSGTHSVRHLSVLALNEAVKRAQSFSCSL